MLPAAYQLPAALVLLLGGAIACFYGYRLFRVVLAIFGFILGAMLASSVFGANSTTFMLSAALIGGLLGAGILMAAYFLGVALVGAGLGVTAAHIVLTATDREPQLLVIVGCAMVGAIAATYLQRYVIIVGTAFGGAWTLIVGVMALLGNRGALAAVTSGDVWVAYPLDPAPGYRWISIVWMVLGLAGAVVQLGWTGGEKGRVVKRRKK